MMIAHAIGANVIAIDICDDKLKLAQSLGAVATVNASRVADVTEAVLEITKGGAHVSLDALGHPTTCFNSINNLRRRGRHVQVGLMLAERRRLAKRLRGKSRMRPGFTSAASAYMRSPT